MNSRNRLFNPLSAQVLLVSLALGGVGAFLLGLQQSLKTAEDNLRPSLKVVLFVQSSVSDAEAEKWAPSLRATDPDMTSVDYVSRSEALRRAQGNPALIKSLLLLHENPLPASVILHYKDQVWLSRPEPALAFKGLPQVQDIRWSAEDQSRFKSLHDWRVMVQRLGWTSVAAGALSFCTGLGRMIFLVLLICPLPAFCATDASNVILKRYEKQIHSQEKQLTRLRSQLSEKERDVSRWQAKADASRAAWSQASTQIEQTSGRIKAIRLTRQHTTVLAEAAEWKSTENVLVAQSAATQSRALARELYEAQLLNPSASRLSVDEAAPEYVLTGMTQLSSVSQLKAQEGQKEESALRAEEARLQSDEEARTREAELLHEQQEAQWSRWQDALKRKTALVDEISQIDQSAKALQVMLGELRDHLDQARALRQNHSANDQAVARLRGTLPWPAQGKVVQNYGRQYSDGLNQLVVSNGIKIESGAHHTVRAIDQGKVLYASPFRDYGQLVIVQHKNGLTSVYGGLGETSVKEGQDIAALDPVGQTADAGSFYFELRHDEQPINPLVYLSPAPSSLSSRRTFR